MYAPGRLVYMDKIAVGEEAAESIDLDAPIEENLRRVARATGKAVDDLTAIILDRPRNRPHIEAVRRAGARIRLIRDGDIVGRHCRRHRATAASTSCSASAAPPRR